MKPLVDEWDHDTGVIDLPMRPPAVIVAVPRDDDAVPRYIAPEQTRPFGSPRQRLILTTTTWGE